MPAPAATADRIRAARELLGISQEQLAGASGLSQALISQLENGGRKVTDDSLSSIAGGTGLPASFFLKTVQEIPENSFRFRRYRSTSAGARRRVRRTFQELFDVAQQLMDWGGQPHPRLPEFRAAEGISDQEIEDIATETRRYLGIAADVPVRHLTRALERSSVPVAPIVFGDLSPEEADMVAAIGHFGISARVKESGRSVVGYFPSPGDRQRFTLAHELGHLVLHDEKVSETVAERQADLFAGSFLLPRQVALTVFRESSTLRNLAKIKSEWGISIQALAMRAWHVGIINDDRRTSLFKQISARGWRQQEPVIVRNENPALLGMLVAKRFGGRAGRYSRAASSLGLTALQLHAMMPPVEDRPLKHGSTAVSPLPLTRSGGSVQ